MEFYITFDKTPPLEAWGMNYIVSNTEKEIKLAYVKKHWGGSVEVIE